jgi:hypothetical protein
MVDKANGKTERPYSHVYTPVDPPHPQHHGFVGLKALPIDPSEKASEIHIRCIESSISDDPSAFSPLFDKL